MTSHDKLKALDYTHNVKTSGYIKTFMYSDKKTMIVYQKPIIGNWFLVEATTTETICVDLLKIIYDRLNELNKEE